ncbi:unnamed protein product, partial [Ectocarpus sp. 8 AP-2014]
GAATHNSSKPPRATETAALFIDTRCCHYHLVRPAATASRCWCRKTAQQLEHSSEK